MFDAVLASGTVQRRWGSGVALTGMAHLAVFVIAVFLTRPTPHIESGKPEVVWPSNLLKNSVTFSQKPPASSSTASAKNRTQATALRRSPKEFAPHVVNVLDSANIETNPTEGVGAGNPTDVGTEFGGGTGSSSTGPIPFEGQMTHPQKISGPDPVYTAQAQEREIQGMMLVTCVVTTAGEVQNCRVVKGLPFLEASAINALERRKYSPATLDGTPVDVEYTFRIPFVLPD